MLKQTIKQLAATMGVLESVQKQRSAKAQKVNFQKELETFKRLQAEGTPRFSLREDDLLPYLDDNTSYTWFDRHYVYHPAWAARVVKKIAPAFHIDISSTLNFSAMLSTFIPVKFYDYRPAKLYLDGLSSERADLCDLHFESNTIQSLSCMHTVEHVGLGRYGDPLDYNGDLKAMAELSRVVAPGGNLLFVVPVGGKARIQFNAHRIYTKQMVVESFPDMELKEFTLISNVSDERGLIQNPDDETLRQEDYGCGCFWFVKK